MKTNKLRYSIFLLAAKLQDRYNHEGPTYDHFSCLTIERCRPFDVDREIEFYNSLFGLLGETFTSLLGLKNYNDQVNAVRVVKKANELRVLALLLAHEIAKNP